MATAPAPIARCPSYTAWSWLWAALLLGCEAVAPASAQVPDRAPTAAVAPAPAMPLGDMTPPAAGDERFAGVVEEVLAAGSYAYLGVRTEGRLRWVATMGEGRPIGTRVVVRSMGTRLDFHSRRLDRTFSELVFGVVDDAA